MLRHAAIATGDSASLATAQNQLQHLTSLARRIDHASPGSLAAMRGEVMAFVAASQTTAQHTRGSVAAAQVAEVALHAAQAEARRVTGDFVHDFYERKIFDPYLTFASAEEERAYREREEARLLAIEAARAGGTPEGDLLAARLALAQLEDAGAHGADASPEYRRQQQRLTSQERNLSTALGVESETATHDAETVAPTAGATFVSPDIIAALRDAGAVIGDSSQQGHGVLVGRTSDPSLLRS